MIKPWKDLPKKIKRNQPIGFQWQPISWPTHFIGDHAFCPWWYADLNNGFLYEMITFVFIKSEKCLLEVIIHMYLWSVQPFSHVSTFDTYCRMGFFASAKFYEFCLFGFLKANFLYLSSKINTNFNVTQFSYPPTGSLCLPSSKSII